MKTPKFLNHWLAPSILVALGMPDLIRAIFQRPPVMGWPGWLLLCSGLILGHFNSGNQKTWLFPTILIGIGISEPITWIYNNPNGIGWPAWLFLAGGFTLWLITSCKK